MSDCWPGLESFDGMPALGTTSLLERIRQGAEPDDWRLLVDRYWRPVYAFGRRHGLTGADAEDFTQDVLIELTRVLPGFEYDRDRGSFQSFLLTLCRRRLIDRLRRHDLSASSELGNVAGDDEVLWWERESQRGLLRACLDEAAHAVEPRTYQAFQLTVIEQWPAKQVAEFLELSIDSVYQAKARVLRHARAAYEAMRKDDGDE